MPATVLVNKLTVVHRDSNGLVTFMPDVCLTPSPGGPVPIPYPNIAMSQDTDRGSSSVSCDGNPIMLKDSEFSKSTGDEAGTSGGVASGTTRGPAQFMNYSFDVKADGEPVARMGDLMLGNKGAAFNTPPAPEVQPPAVVIPNLEQSDEPAPDKLTFVVTDSGGQPVKDTRFIAVLPGGKEVEATTDSNGRAEISETVSGVCRVLFPDNPGPARHL